jgi:hypothetical protein
MGIESSYTSKLLTGVSESESWACANTVAIMTNEAITLRGQNLTHLQLNDGNALMPLIWNLTKPGSRKLSIHPTWWLCSRTVVFKSGNNWSE